MGARSFETDRDLVAEYVKDGRDILAITDSSETYSSGISTVMSALRREVLRLTGGRVEVRYVTPLDVPNLRGPGLIDVLGFLSFSRFRRMVASINPCAIHLMTERYLGHQARRHLLRMGLPFTTSYLTGLPQYFAVLTERTLARPGGRSLAARLGPLAGRAAEQGVAGILRRFHSASSGVLVPAPTLLRQLTEAGYPPGLLRGWSHGVDCDTFHPRAADPRTYAGLQRPISLFVGRVEAEKNIEDFLEMDIPGTKVVAGKGRDREALQRRYPRVVFLGELGRDALPRVFASADRFVFPSLIDTFGLVQLEALASGLPVVAYDVQGPRDVVTSDAVGRLARHVPGDARGNLRRLEEAWAAAGAIERHAVRAFAEGHTWEESALQFLTFLRRLPKSR